MNYNRFLDIHLCTCTNLEGTPAVPGGAGVPAAPAVPGVRAEYSAAHMYFTSDGTPYFYQFTNDIMRQMRYRESKAEGFVFNEKNTGNCRILTDVELTDATDGFLRLTSTTDTSGGSSRTSYSINEQLKQLRYVGCMVSIEHLKTNAVYPQLQALMLWISDPATMNKLRINCHGSGTATGVMTMGQESLSPEQLVSALVRHGLTRPSPRTASAIGLAQNARWKLDSEKDACEKCNKKFGVFTRKHHCRRCGGLFCDTCSSKKADLAVALTGEERGKAVQQTATARNVRNARVCDACYSAAGSPAARALAEDPVLRDVFGESVAAAAGEAGLTNCGLKTITLALCMGAKAEEVYSLERDPNTAIGPQLAGTFARDSLAGRLLTALRDPNHDLRGIKVAASNQVLQGSDKGILAVCGVDYPTNWYTYLDRTTMKYTASKTIRNPFAVGSGTFLIPAYIWGERTSLQTKLQMHTAPQPALRNAPPPRFTGDIAVGARCLYFSKCGSASDLYDVYKDFYKHWNFTSWHKRQHFVPRQPGGNAAYHTWQMIAPERVKNITAVPGTPGSNNNQISITGRETEYFKDYKSYEVS